MKMMNCQYVKVKYNNPIQNSPAVKKSVAKYDHQPKDMISTLGQENCFSINICTLVFFPTELIACYHIMCACNMYYCGEQIIH